MATIEAPVRKTEGELAGEYLELNLDRITGGLTGRIFPEGWTKPLPSHAVRVA